MSFECFDLTKIQKYGADTIDNIRLHMIALQKYIQYQCFNRFSIDF